MPRIEVKKDFYMFYQDVGAGEIVVFVHGLGGSHASFDLQVKKFSKRFRCIVPDLRGYGSSDESNTKYTFDELADDVVSMLDKIGCRRANFVGVSMGGMVVQKIMIDHFEIVDKAVLVSTAPTSTYCKKQINIEFIKDYDFNIQRIAETASNVLFPGDENESKRQEYTLEYNKNKSETFRKNYRQIQLLDNLEGLNKYKKDVLIIHGEDDPLVDITFAELLNSLLVNSKLIKYKEVGHTPHRNKPGQFNKEIIRFIK